ncbi:MAG TPA: hypothetical protein VHR45_04665 [Thermoanaerobaculia bacterium]|nr:hypothetical protein [Thermoanaerobaculia bacterium]
MANYLGAHRYKSSGIVVFYRTERESAEDEHLGILEPTRTGGFFLETQDGLADGALIRMRIYSEEGITGQTELSIRGVVQRVSQNPRGADIQLVDSNGVGARKLKGLLETMVPTLRPPQAQAASGFASARG